MGPQGGGARARSRRRRWLVPVGGLVVLLGVVGAATATHLAIDTEHHTTLDQILTCANPFPNPPPPQDPCSPKSGYKTLRVEDVDDNYIVRDPANVLHGNLNDGRERRRRSLAYFSQLTDFQLADEESPARVEFVDSNSVPSAWRPQEAFQPFLIDASIRQINAFAQASPVPQGNGIANAMDFALATGDQADNQQRNEMIWTRVLLEGGTVSFGSGADTQSFYEDARNLTGDGCAAFLAQEGGPANAAAEGANYTGVQDYLDYPTDPGGDPKFYDPNDPRGDYAGWPTYTGLMDRAQDTFTTAGLDVPSYWVNGNHDVLVQGNEDANQSFERIATGCNKTLAIASTPTPPGGVDGIPSALLAPASETMLVPPDPLRRFVSKPQIKAIIGQNNVDHDHGFDFVSAAQNTASNSSASYYAWNPPQTPGVRFIAIDTNSEGGVVGPLDPADTGQSVPGSSDGNLDNPQFNWLKGQLDAAQAAGKLIVLFGHHPVRTMTAPVPDEAASQCTVNDTHDDNHDGIPDDNPGHDVNPGCDVDQRPSEPIHLGDPQIAQALGSNAKTFTELIADYRNVVAYVAGHTHENKLIPFTRPDGSVWWEINTSATADWPQQHRLIEIMDNRNDTLSIFGTVLDFASPATAPDCDPSVSVIACDAASTSNFSLNDLASIGRALGYNDPQKGPPSGEGTAQDQNVEMLVDDPRQANLKITKLDDPDPVRFGQTLFYKLKVENLGPSGATAVTVRDRLPNQLLLVSAKTSRGSCSASGATVTCRLGDMPAVVGKQQVVIAAKVQGAPRTIANTATVASITDDPQPANNTDTESTRVIR